MKLYSSQDRNDGPTLTCPSNGTNSMGTNSENQTISNCTHDMSNFRRCSRQLDVVLISDRDVWLQIGCPLHELSQYAAVYLQLMPYTMNGDFANATQFILGTLTK
jgi:hypothetical protein